jgi:nucleoside 2-deoxyribosyltransferase
MKIFFSVSIAGDNEHKKFYPEIISELKKHGEVLTEFRDVDSKQYADGQLSTEDIYKRDTSLIRESDILVADISIPSLGVGYEIAYAEALKKPIICLYMPIEGIKFSAMVKGCPNVKVCEYHNMEEMREIFKKELGKK